MQSRSRTTYGNVVETFTADTNNDTFGYSSVRSAPGVLDGLQVDVPGTTHGDFRTPNAFAYTKDFVDGMKGTYLARRGNDSVPGTRTGEGELGVNVNRGLFAEFQADTYNTTVDRLNERLRGQIDLSIDLLQLGDSLALARNIGRVISQIRALRKGNLEDWYREFKRYEHGSPKSIGSKWLSWVYGIKPTLQTIYDLLQFRLNRVQHLMVVEARATITGAGQKEAQAWKPDTDHTCYVTWTASDRCHIKVRMKPPETFMQVLANLTSLNPASIAWELTPFSFVVDWFYDVGGYLRALETALIYGSLFVDGFILRTYRNWGECRINSRVDYGSDTFNIYVGSGTYQKTRYERVPLLGYPFPKLPVFKADLSSAQLLNAAALLSQRLR